MLLTLWRPVAFGDEKKHTETHMSLHGNFSGLVSATDMVEVSKDAVSLLVCTLKKFFWLGAAEFL